MTEQEKESMIKEIVSELRDAVTGQKTESAKPTHWETYQLERIAKATVEEIASMGRM